MAIRKRGNALQIDVGVTYKGEQKRHREKFTGSMKDAEAREAAIKADLLAGRDPKRSSTSDTPKKAARFPLKEALETVWEKYWANAGCARTVRSNMKAACDYFGDDRCLTEITTDDADAYIAHLQRQGNAASTIRSKCACLTKTFNHFYRRGNIKSKPYFEMPKVGDNTRDRIIDELEFHELCRLFTEVWDVAQPRRSDGHVGQSWADWLVFLMDTGMRPSEGREAELRNLRNGRLTLKKTKTSTHRVIPLTARALEAFERQAFTHGNKPFFWATKDAFRHAWDWARTSMNLSDDEGFIPYALRHTCATKLYALKKDLLVVQKWMGHTDIKMTLRYAKLMPGDLEDARDLLQGFQSPRAPLEVVDDQWDRGLDRWSQQQGG